MGKLKITNETTNEIKYSNFETQRRYQPRRYDSKGDVMQESKEEHQDIPREPTEKEEEFIKDFSRHVKCTPKKT